METTNCADHDRKDAKVNFVPPPLDVRTYSPLLSSPLLSLLPAHLPLNNSSPRRVDSSCGP